MNRHSLVVASASFVAFSIAGYACHPWSGAFGNEDVFGFILLPMRVFSSFSIHIHPYLEKSGVFISAGVWSAAITQIFAKVVALRKQRRDQPP